MRVGLPIVVFLFTCGLAWGAFHVALTCRERGAVSGVTMVLVAGKGAWESWKTVWRS